MANAFPHRFDEPPLMNVLWFEFMLSLRRLGRRKVQNGLLLVTFAVSISLSLLSWSLFHTIFLRNPDFDPKGSLYILSYAGAIPGGSNWKRSTRRDLEAWKVQQTTFSDFTGMVLYRSSFIAAQDGAERVLSANVSSESLRMVGAQPLLGRLFTADDDKFGCAPVVILSYRTWRNRFGGDPEIIGRIVKLDNVGATVVGVMPEDFRFPNDQDVWQPLGMQEDYQDWAAFDILVRLKPGVTQARAEADMQLLLTRRGADSPAFVAGLRPMLMPFREYYLKSELQSSALVLFALSLLFVAVSCSNAANLMMIDFLGRAPEIAASIALGLPKRALIRGLCYQIGLIAVVAVVVSLGAVLLAAPFLHQALALMNAPYWLQFTFQWHLVAMALALALGCALAAVTAPILYLAMASPERMMREGAGAARGTGHAWWRRTLLAGQIALLTILGISATLLVRSSFHLSEQYWGYEASHVFMGKLDLNQRDPSGAGATQRMQTFRRIIDEAGRLPDVQAAAVMAKPLGYSGNPNITYAKDLAALTDNRPLGAAMYSEVTEDIFATLGVPLVAGTTFPRLGKTLVAPVPMPAIINQALAERLWPGQDPLQRALYVRYFWMGPKDPSVQVVICGVVQDFQASGPQSANNDCIYVPFSDWMPNNLFFLVSGRTRLPAVKTINDLVHTVDPRIALYFPDSLAHQIIMTQSSTRLTARLTLVYAVAAVLLCATGVYSLTVSQIIQRAREFGIRMALGIEPYRLWLYFTRSHLVSALVGIIIGVAISSQSGRVLQSLLYGVDQSDPATFLLVPLAILVIAALACIPSLFRLKRINPADCLRSL